MPPQISEDESSISSEEQVPIGEEKVVVAKEEIPAKAIIEETQESLMVDSDNEDDEEDDEERAEDVYLVEAITDHLIDEDTSQILYRVKWEGYEREEDMTWEPETNLETASEILEDYLAKVGGKESILKQWREKKAAGKGKKRGRASTASAANAAPAKRGRKNGSHPAESTPPAGAKEAEFRPPTGSWEDEVVGIDACEGNAGAVVVYLTWKGGQKTQHPLAQVYKRCPQKNA